MTHPLIYPAMGLSCGARKRSLRDKALRMADTLSSRGLPTRLPFLKKALCGIDSDQALSPKPIGPPPKSFVLRLYTRDMFDWSLSHDGIMRWNSATLGDGIQYVPVKEGEREVKRFEQRRCITSLEGDLKVTSVPGDDPSIRIPQKAFYSDQLFQIFLNPQELASPKDFPPELLKDGPISNLDAVMAHEKEHAIHLTLWKIAGLPARLLPAAAEEFLAMLSATVNAGDGGLLGESRILFWKRIGRRDTRPYAFAARYFEHRMLNGYRMTPLVLDAAMCAAVFPKKASRLDFECLEKVRECGKIEFDRAYRMLFGLGLGDIREVVSTL